MPGHARRAGSCAEVAPAPVSRPERSGRLPCIASRTSPGCERVWDWAALRRAERPLGPPGGGSSSSRVRSTRAATMPVSVPTKSQAVGNPDKTCFVTRARFEGWLPGSRGLGFVPTATITAAGWTCCLSRPCAETRVDSRRRACPCLNQNIMVIQAPESYLLTRSASHCGRRAGRRVGKAAGLIDPAAGAWTPDPRLLRTSISETSQQKLCRTTSSCSSKADSALGTAARFCDEAGMGTWKSGRQGGAPGTG